MYQEHDELRARFTTWMEVTLYRARKGYIDKRNRQIPTQSFDEVLEETVPSPQNETVSEDAFEFQQDQLANAFAHLSVRKQIILTMLFVEERKPAEVARCLHCTPQHIYDQRYQALKALRKALDEESECK